MSAKRCRIYWDRGRLARLSAVRREFGPGKLAHSYVVPISDQVVFMQTHAGETPAVPVKSLSHSSNCRVAEKAVFPSAMKLML